MDPVWIRIYITPSLQHPYLTILLYGLHFTLEKMFIKIGSGKKNFLDQKWEKNFKRDEKPLQGEHPVFQNPYVFRPTRSGSVIISYGSGSFHQQKIRIKMSQIRNTVKNMKFSPSSFSFYGLLFSFENRIHGPS